MTITTELTYHLLNEEDELNEKRKYLTRCDRWAHCITKWPSVASVTYSRTELIKIDTANIKRWTIYTRGVQKVLQILYKKEPQTFKHAVIF